MNQPGGRELANLEPPGPVPAQAQASTTPPPAETREPRNLPAPNHTAGPPKGSSVSVKPFDQDEAHVPAAYALAARVAGTTHDAPTGLQRERRSGLSKITRKLRLGLRARTTFALALLSLLISIVVSSLTYFVARTSFVKERRINIERLAFANAEVASRELIDNQQNMNLVLERIDAESGLAARSLLVYDGREYSRGSSLKVSDVPASLQALLAADSTTDKTAHAAYQITKGEDGTRLVVGVAPAEVG